MREQSLILVKMNLDQWKTVQPGFDYTLEMFEIAEGWAAAGLVAVNILT